MTPIIAGGIASWRTGNAARASLRIHWQWDALI